MSSAMEIAAKELADLIAAAKSPKSAIDALKADVESRSINIKYPPAPLVGAVGGGSVDDTTAIQNIYNFAGTNGFSVQIPDDTFLVSALTSGGCRFIFGNGENSVLKTSTTSTILTLDSDSVIVSGIKFEGTGINQKGIVNTGNFMCEVVNCIFDNLKGVTGGGIYISEVGTSQYGLLDGMKITNCKFYRCTRGVDCGINAEYVTINGCVFQNQCGWAIHTQSGNTLINDCNITKVQNGIRMSGVSNGAHSSITGCNINHIFTDSGGGTYTPGYGLWFEDVALGNIVTGSSLFDCIIMIKNSMGIRISQCNLGIVTYYFEGSNGCSIEDNNIYKSYGHAVNPAYNGKPSFVQWQNNRNISNGTHGTASEEMLGGQVKGTITGQTITTGAAQTTIAVTAVSNSANYANQAKHSWWNPTTNKAKNLGYGGNRIKIDVQFYVTYGAGANTQATIGYLYVGTKLHALNRIIYMGLNVYYNFYGDVIAEPNEEIYVQLLNNSGQTATVTTTNGRFILEGL